MLYTIGIYTTAVSLSCSSPFYKIMVPTVDTVRYNLLVKALVLSQYPVLLTGPVGTGKTSVAQTVLQGLDNKWTALTINMSSQVSALLVCHLQFLPAHAAVTNISPTYCDPPSLTAWDASHALTLTWLIAVIEEWSCLFACVCECICLLSTT